LTEAVFAPLPFDVTLVNSTLHEYRLPTAWRNQPWKEVWDAGKFFHQCTVWLPIPGIARQALIFALEAWVEKPLTSSSLFFIPRTLAGSWRGLSRHLDELILLKSPRLLQLINPPVLPIPVAVRYLASHARCLPSPDRLVESSLPANVA
jgi:hypothetical protein